MDRRSGHRRSHQAAAAALALILAGCAHDQAKPDPVAAICSIPYPPVLTRDEAVATPPRLRRWVSGTKHALEDNGCPYASSQ